MDNPTSAVCQLTCAGFIGSQVVWLAAPMASLLKNDSVTAPFKDGVRRMIIELVEIEGLRDDPIRIA